jgi:RHS repeat-associated protein
MTYLCDYDQGYRISKTMYSFPNYVWTLVEEVEYDLVDDKVVYETNGTYGILFTYDYDGTLISFNYDANVNDSTAGTKYFYLRNQQGDITMITDVSGNVVMKYAYDAYGYMTSTPTSGYTDLTNINPYTYRGYRYDSDTGMYYLNSRYYNPQIGRFLNSDGLLGDTGDILSTNMYAYCANNPVMYSDISGFAPEWLKTAGIIGAIVGTVLVVAAITVLTCGVGTTVLAGTLAGAIIHGAAVDALIGAAAGIGLGATAGAVGSLIAGEKFGSEEFWSNTLYGSMAGFGAGAIIGAAIGGVAGGLSYTPSGLSRGAINQAVKSTLSNSNKMHHIMMPKHGLPNSINAVGNLMRNTLINGTISSYGSASTAIWAAGGAQVTYIIDGLIRISDMWAI